MQDRTDSTTYYNRGIVNYKRREYDKAVEDFSKAIELNPIFENLEESNKVKLFEHFIDDFKQVIKESR
ncbi:tetratricopeptide repeat protein [Candidatus Poribacteria bacterium]|nr:tetratricopeptide repeat protein [Candidatus Poribacteria bacterium]